MYTDIYISKGKQSGAGNGKFSACFFFLSLMSKSTTLVLHMPMESW